VVGLLVAAGRAFEEPPVLRGPAAHGIPACGKAGLSASPRRKPRGAERHIRAAHAGSSLASRRGAKPGPGCAAGVIVSLRQLGARRVAR